MMKKTRYTSRLGMVALLCVTLGVGLLFAGCGKAPQDEKKAVTKVETKVSAPAPAKAVTTEKTPDKQAAQGAATQPTKAATPVKTPEIPAEKAEKAPSAAAPTSTMPTPAPTRASLSPQASEADILAAIEASADPFEFYTLQQEVTKRPEASKAVRDAVEKKWQELEKSKPSQTLIEGLQFVAFRMEFAGEGKAKLSILLKTTADLATDYQLSVLGTVDPMHKSFLSEGARKMGDREEWVMREWDYTKSEWKADDMSEWKAGEYHMFSRTGGCAPIPYNLSTTLEIYSNKGGYVATAGNMITLGWHAALDK
ncbi:MAG: hypothetical protein NTZ09_02880 [Candidatus Hydrogenedentes bacterium]|nr:hypothetical protein [Candidatus Hydrogenedentota bacterium]